MDLREIRARGEVVRHPWELARFEVVCDLLKKYVGEKDRLNILDLGCGDTFFVENLAQRFTNSQFYGVDIEFADEDLEMLSDKLKDEPIQLFRTLDDLEAGAAPKAIDIVLLLDVVEHIEFDVEFLQMLHNKSYITDQTKIFITVPAFQSLYTSHDDFLGHYRRYDNTHLERTIQKAGFQKLKVGYFFGSLLPVRALKVVKEKLFGKDEESTGLVEWSGSKGKTNLIKNVLQLDYKIGQITGGKLPGLSNYIVINKDVRR
ncbi:MAG: methyltransferase domain-containing protein [Bacteroidota bacterium]